MRYGIKIIGRTERTNTNVETGKTRTAHLRIVELTAKYRYWNAGTVCEMDSRGNLYATADCGPYYMGTL
jgi:hypothetical protein